MKCCVQTYTHEKPVERCSFYQRFGKRALDVLLSAALIVLLSWLLLIVAILIRIRIGTPVIFSQIRPGLNEKLFKIIKFRTMTNEHDSNGNLLPDDRRMTKLGRWLRKTSLDELPELFNILKGDMSFVGPRPQLVRDMVFMTQEQRKRHTIMPGLTGLAQISGRNAISWEKKLDYDLKYMESVSLCSDLKIVVLTVIKAFVTQEDVSAPQMETSMDLGDYLLKIGLLSEADYERRQYEATQIEAATKQ